MRVTVTGAGGYVGSRLVPALLALGHEVTATFTDVSRAGRFWWADLVTAVQADVLDRAAMRAACHDSQALYYLVHALSGQDFASRDRQGAYNAAHAAVRSGVERIVYLGGLVPPTREEDLSPHLRSRLEVEEILTDSGLPTLALRAAMVVGSGSTSFEIMRQVIERLPLQVMPTWMRSRVEPVAVDDVLVALTGSLDAAARSRSYDVGGGEQLPYAVLLRLFAERAGLSRPQVTVPLLPVSLVARLAPALTSAPASTVQTLVESLQHDMVCADRSFLADLMPPDHVLTPLTEAIERALAAVDPDVPDCDRDPLGPLRTDASWVGGQQPVRP